MNRLQSARANKKKGFTLVEIIVVLVIIAILLAALAPVMIGWIQEARDTTLKAEARLGMNAAQSIGTEYAALAKPALGADITAATGANWPTVAMNTKFQELIADLAAADFKTFVIDYQSLKVKSFTYVKAGAGRTVTFDGTTYTVTKTP